MKHKIHEILMTCTIPKTFIDLNVGTGVKHV